MGGGGGAAQQAELVNAQSQASLGQQQIGLEQQYGQLAQQQLNTATQLDAPLVNFNNQILSGNPQAQIAAAGPQLGNIATQTQSAEANVMNSVPAGAGRDYALAQAQLGQGSQTAGLLNQLYTGALQSDAQLGSQALGAGLSEQGATLSAASGATSSYGASNQAYGQIQQVDAQNKASTLGFFGALAGAGGTAFEGKSDARLKEDIEKVGEIGDVNIYQFRFKEDGNFQLGVMAQEVFATHPDAVIVGGEDPNESPWRVKYDELVKQLVDDK